MWASFVSLYIQREIGSIIIDRLYALQLYENEGKPEHLRTRINLNM